MFKQLTERLSYVVSVVCRHYSLLILVSDVSINIFWNIMKLMKIMKQKIIAIELSKNLDLQYKIKNWVN